MTEKTDQAKNFRFKAEVSQLLDILTHSLYTHRDVFIRELISNAADALDKVRFKEVKGEKSADPDLKLEIRITLDKDKNTFTITDTGIGMSRDELVRNIGTIARSGTSEFLKQMSGQESDINLIGRFGVGFYSVFMAAENVRVVSRSADSSEPPFEWISDGKGSFHLEPAPGDTKRGTTIHVQLREDASEFSDKQRVQTAIEKYSNFVPFPIFIDKEKVNKISAIWREPRSSIKKDQYNEFYKFIAHQNDDALTWLHFSADVPLQFHALLFVPRTNFELMGFGREDDGIHLFVKRVLIDPRAKEILPPYLRFIRGVLESDDLPLNISRETLQENPYIVKIKNTVISRLLGHIKEFAGKNPEEYRIFWKQHGRILKEGYNDYTHKDDVAALFRFNSSKCKNADELIDLKTYVDRMQEKQEQIYFLSGPSREALEANPVMEIFKARDIEVLYCFDPIDEFVLPGLITFADKMLISADQAESEKLDAISSGEMKPPADRPDAKSIEKLARRMKDILGKQVEDVKVSGRLTDSPAMLVGSNRAMSSQMEKIMHMMNDQLPLSAKILEINPDHALIRNCLKIYEKNATDPLLDKLVAGLFISARLLDGSVEKPQTMAADIQSILSDTVNLYLKDAQKSQPQTAAKKKPSGGKKTTAPKSSQKKKTG